MGSPFTVCAFPLCFAYYNRIHLKKNIDLYKYTQVLACDQSFHLIWWCAGPLETPKETPGEEFCDQRWQVLFILAPATKRKTTFPPGCV